VCGVSNGTRTRDILDHNQVLYQLSYTHHARMSVPGVQGCSDTPADAPSAPRWRAAMRLLSSLSGPGWGTKIASR
jgi:hypothetical protein